MFRNYLLITFRNFKGQKLFSLLNIFGLALGLASAILAFGLPVFKEGKTLCDQEFNDFLLK